MPKNPPKKKGAGLPHPVLHCMFWSKTMLAISIAVAGLAYWSWRVTDLHLKASPPLGPNSNTPIDLPELGSPESASCIFPADSKYARLQPRLRNDQMLMGFSIDWSKQKPSDVVRLLDNTPAVFNTFMDLNMNNNPIYDTSMLNWFGSEVGRVGGILELTMSPSSALTGISTEILTTLAKQCREINSKYGVPILLRWGHEMNGDWPTYGMQPVDFVESFRRLTVIVRQYTNLTAMVWGPNIGITYPFTGGGPRPVPGTPNFQALDTNGDGQLTIEDDPYGPYYPGDEYVDWVGLSLYYYPENLGANADIPTTYLHDYLTGSGPVVERVTGGTTLSYRTLRNFYQRFVVDKKKPFMLPETGAPMVSGQTRGVGEVQIKEQWWTQVFKAVKDGQFPGLTLAVNFEEAKMLNGFENDWQLTKNPGVLTMFKNLLKAQGDEIVEGPRMKYTCDGSVTIR